MEDNKMKEGIRKMTLDELDEVAGGRRGDKLHTLKNYVAGTVRVPEGKHLVMQRTPRGAFMSIKYADGDHILVYPELMSNYYLAYDWKTDIYGFVDSKYVELV